MKTTAPAAATAATAPDGERSIGHRLVVATAVVRTKDGALVRATGVRAERDGLTRARVRITVNDAAGDRGLGVVPLGELVDGDLVVRGVEHDGVRRRGVNGARERGRAGAGRALERVDLRDGRVRVVAAAVEHLSDIELTAALRALVAAVATVLGGPDDLRIQRPDRGYLRRIGGVGHRDGHDEHLRVLPTVVGSAAVERIAGVGIVASLCSHDVLEQIGQSWSHRSMVIYPLTTSWPAGRVPDMTSDMGDAAASSQAPLA